MNFVATDVLPSTPLLTVEQAAAALNMSPEAIRARVRRGELAGYRLGAGSKARIRIAPAALASFLRPTTPEN